VDDVRFYLPHAPARYARHVFVEVIELVRAGEALLRAAHPSNGDPLVLVILRLVGPDAAAGDAALGGEDEGFVSPGFQLARQP
jgi:hypothetical protein